MNGLPVTVRLLDPPLHEFLPKTEKDIDDIAKELNISNQNIKSRIIELHEQNPMLGHRGCRLGISFPEIYQMQCQAIFEALAKCKKKKIKASNTRNNDSFSIYSCRNTNTKKTCW